MKHRKQVLAMAAEKAVSQKQFVKQLIDRVAEADGLESYTITKETDSSKKRTSLIKIASIDVKATYVYATLRSLAGDSRLKHFWEMVVKDAETPDTTFPDDPATESRTNWILKTHVTLAHYHDTTQHDLKRVFQPLCGSKVIVTVMGLLWSPHRVAALAVEICSENQDGVAVPPPRNVFPHLTVWCHESASAVEANDLPHLVEQGQATRINFDHPIPLTGEVSLWI